MLHQQQTLDCLPVQQVGLQCKLFSNAAPVFTHSAETITMKQLIKLATNSWWSGNTVTSS